MHGIQALLDCYREAHARLTRKLPRVNYATTATFTGAEVYSEFTLLRDFKHESALDCKAGDHFIGDNFVHYAVRDGRIPPLKPARLPANCLRYTVRL